MTAPRRRWLTQRPVGPGGRVDGAVTARLDQLDSCSASTKQEWSMHARRSLARSGPAQGHRGRDRAAARSASTATGRSTGTARAASGPARSAIRSCSASCRGLHASVTASLADRDELRGRLDASGRRRSLLGRSEDVDLDGAISGRSTPVPGAVRPGRGATAGRVLPACAQPAPTDRGPMMLCQRARLRRADRGRLLQRLRAGPGAEAPPGPRNRAR